MQDAEAVGPDDVAVRLLPVHDTLHGAGVLLLGADGCSERQHEHAGCCGMPHDCAHSVGLKVATWSAMRRFCPRVNSIMQASSE